MPTPHFNYYPPAGQVIDASDGRVTWDGRAWKLNGRVYGVPSTHSLVGKPGTPLSGWYYDWGRRAWMEPSAPKPTPTSTPIRRPSTVPASTTVVAIESTKRNPIESLMKHPIAPVLGGVLVAASYLTDEPTPPTIPERMPEASAKQWMMIYQQNQQRFARRMDLYKDLGMVLLGYASAQTILDALPTAPAATTAVDNAVRATNTAAHRAM